jgi:tetratricopeptide (TPR) repeat protein
MDTSTHTDLISRTASTGEPHLSPAPDPAPIETLRAELAALRAHIGRNDREIDDLQVRAAESHRPWHRNSQTLVAVFALLLSLVTATTSAYWAKTQGDAAELRLEQERIHDAKTELRELLQAIAGLRRQALQLEVSDNAQTDIVLATSLTGELELLANQAFGVAESIPDQVTATEYFTLAEVLGEGGQIQQQKAILELALPKAGTPFEMISVNRLYAIVLFNADQYETAREHMATAVSTGEAHFDDGLLALGWPQLENLRSETFWAFWESWDGYCDEARTHLEAADALYRELGLLPEHPVAATYSDAQEAVNLCVEGEPLMDQIEAPTQTTPPFISDVPSLLDPAIDMPPIATQPAANGAAQEISIDSSWILPGELTIPAYTDVTLRVTNNTAFTEMFSIAALGISIDIAPGMTETLTLNEEPGIYEFNSLSYVLDPLRAGGTLIVE